VPEKRRGKKEKAETRISRTSTDSNCGIH
jgi:hypothetical protein